MSRKVFSYAMDVVSLIALGFFFKRLFHLDLIDATLDPMAKFLGMMLRGGILNILY